MKHLLLLSAALIILGCTTAPRPNYCSNDIVADELGLEQNAIPFVSTTSGNTTTINAGQYGSYYLTSNADGSCTNVYSQHVTNEKHR